MPGPDTPTPPSGNVAPPVFNLPFGEIHADGKVYPTAPFLQFLQVLWASIAGSGGVIDLGYLLINAQQPGPPPAPAPKTIPWTPTIRGSAVAGAQTYGAQWGSSVTIGNALFVLFHVALTALDPATAGNVYIGGLPRVASSDAGVVQGGFLSSYANVTQTTGLTQLGVQAVPGAALMAVVQSAPEWAGQELPAAGLAATSSFVGGLCYFN